MRTGHAKSAQTFFSVCSLAMKNFEINHADMVDQLSEKPVKSSYKLSFLRISSMISVVFPSSFFILGLGLAVME